MKIILSAILEGLGTRQDGTLKLALGTNELDISQAGSLFQLRGKFVKVLLSDSNISNMEASLIDEEKMQDGSKSKTLARKQNALFKAMQARVFFIIKRHRTNCSVSNKYIFDHVITSTHP